MLRISASQFSREKILSTIVTGILVCAFMLFGLMTFGTLRASADTLDNQAGAQSPLTIAAAESQTTNDKSCVRGTKNPDGSKRNHQDYAVCMAKEIDKAIADFKAKDYNKSLKDIESAYFGWYENNLEPPSMTLPGNRKVKMEGRFTRVKLAIRNNPDSPDIVKKLETIKIAVARDAMVLDGVLSSKSPESAGKTLLEGHEQKVESATLDWVDFLTSFTLILREGLEALLVVAAIVLYLVKSGNRKLVKHVYIGVAAAVVLSFVLAWIMKIIVGGAGKASELLEGFTMFIAVAMLFYVSNWMLSKSEGENWNKYIQGMVKTEISSNAAKALVFAAFLAVIREGAELVLFYTAAFAGGGHSSLYIAEGFILGIVVLIVIYIIFRFGAVHLPVRPIFMGTSILLFVMCISFVGKGVQELKEASFILGDTNLPWMTYYMPELGIFPQAETVLPQIILFIAAVWVIIAHTRGHKAQLAVAGSEKPEALAKAEAIAANKAEENVSEETCTCSSTDTSASTN